MGVALRPAATRPDPNAPVVVSPPVPTISGRVGIYGGTFDPVHLAHLAVADEAREVAGLERVVFMPAGSPWQKAARQVSPAADRLAMLELAIADDPAFSISRLELDRPGPTYTVDTLAALAATAEAAGERPDLWFILSSEALRGLPTWRDPAGVLDRCRLIVAPRGVPPSEADQGSSTAPVPDADAAWVAAAFPGRADRFVFLEAPRWRLSATEIRARVAAGRSIRHLVPAAVAAYIDDHGLYRDPERRSR